MRKREHVVFVAVAFIRRWKFIYLAPLTVATNHSNIQTHLLLLSCTNSPLLLSCTVSPVRACARSCSAPSHITTTPEIAIAIPQNISSCSHAQFCLQGRARVPAALPARHTTTTPEIAIAMPQNMSHPALLHSFTCEGVREFLQHLSTSISVKIHDLTSSTFSSHAVSPVRTYARSCSTPSPPHNHHT